MGSTFRQDEDGNWVLRKLEWWNLVGRYRMWRLKRSLKRLHETIYFVPPEEEKTDG